MQGAGIGALMRVEAKRADGTRIALCFSTVGTSGIIPIPPVCQQAGAKVFIGVAVPARGMLGPAAIATAYAQNGLPTILPDTGAGGAAHHADRRRP